MDSGGQWSLAKPFPANLLPRLKALESLEWKEIIRTGRRAGDGGGAGGTTHEIPVRDLIDDAGMRLKALKLDDVDTLLSIAVTGRQRLWALRENSTAVLLWWDPNHAICPSGR